MTITVLTAASCVFCAITVRRLYSYINKYRFDESVYTLLFGFVRLRYIVSFYIFFVALTALLGVFLAINIINSGAY